MQYTGDGVRVGPSPHGLGVFSLRPFAIHEMIGPIQGTVVDDPEYESDFCMDLGGRLSLEPAAPFCYLNHSCHPNCMLVRIEGQPRDAAAADSKLWLETLDEIAPGEQMTIDYAWPANAAIPCGCGCPDCRAWVVAADQRDRIHPGKQRVSLPK